MKDYFILKGKNVAADGAPEDIAIMPLGHVQSSKGDFYVDAQSLKEMKEQIKQRGVDLVIDYEHQTLKGVQAPAAGWVKDLYLKDNSIMAKVEWTPQAVKYLENKEYRYLSPVITVRNKDGKVNGLHSIALTNTPAIEGMSPIVNSLNFEMGEENMELIKKLAEILGLDEGATEEQIMEALNTCINENKELKEKGCNPPAESEKVVANKAVCELLGLKAGSPAEDVTAKIMELKGGTIDGINVMEKLKALEKQSQERDAAEAVDMALKAGKITPAQSEWAKSYALSDKEGFEAFMSKAPQIVPMEEILSSEAKELKNDKVSDAAMLVCKQIGVSKEDIEKYGKEK